VRWILALAGVTALWGLWAWAGMATRAEVAVLATTWVTTVLVVWVRHDLRASAGRCSPTWEGSTAGLARVTVATPEVVVTVEYRDHDGRVIARQTEVRSATAPPAVAVPGRFEMVRPLGVPGQGQVRGGTAMISAPGVPSRPAEGEYDASRTREG
jgi:hypothetical protein